MSEHLGRFFEQFGVDTVPCVGLRDAADVVTAAEADAIICDYDLLTAAPPESWQQDPVLSTTSVIAVSLTRHPGEGHVLETSGIVGFLYLPTLQPEDVQRVFGLVRRKRAGINPPAVLPWMGTTAVARAH